MASNIHQSLEEGTEGAFRAACDDMAAAPSEGSLEGKLDAALAGLDDIELNYRDFHTDMAGGVLKTKPVYSAPLYEHSPSMQFMRAPPISARALVLNDPPGGLLRTTLDRRWSIHPDGTSV